MRPTYENGASLANEEAVIADICGRNNLGWEKLPKSYRADYAITKGKIIRAFVEVKCRNNPKDRYPTYMIALGKYIALCELAKYAKVHARLIVKWTDALGYIDLPCDFREVAMGGRTDRGDDADIEPVVYIDIEKFTIIR